MKFIAKWIWSDAPSVHHYNTTAVFCRKFELASCESARMAVAADSWYRLKINGEWVNDGPCRSYPGHFQYDLIDVSTALQPGHNIIEITVRYFGIGTFHQIPQQAGLLAQLEVRNTDGSETVIGTDSSWQAAGLPQLVANTAKISIQQEPFELYDANRNAGEFRPAVTLFNAGEGPWKNLSPRDCRLLSRKEFNLKNFVAASRMPQTHWSFSIPAQKILYPGITSSNIMTSMACGAVFHVYSPDRRSITLTLDNLQAAVNGVKVEKNNAELKAGMNLLVLLANEAFTHRKDLSAAIREADGLRFANPLQDRSDKVCFLRFPAFLKDMEDIPFVNQRSDKGECSEQIGASFDAILRLDAAGKIAQFPGAVVEHLPNNVFSEDDAHWHFRDRAPEPAALGDVIEPENLLYATGDCLFGVGCV